MRIPLRQLYKHLAVIAKIIGFFSIFIFIAHFLYADYQKKEVVYCLLSAIMLSYLGYLQLQYKIWLEQKVSNRSIDVILQIVGYLVVIVSTVTYTFEVLSGSQVFKGLFFIFVLLMQRLWFSEEEKTYNKILSLEAMAIFTATYAAAIFTTRINELGIFYIILVDSCILLSNQGKIDNLLEHAEANTPMFKRMKRDNVKWVGIFGLVVLVIYPFRKGLKRILHTIIYSIEMLCVKILVAFFKLLNWNDIEESKTQPADEPLRVKPSTYVGDHWFRIIATIILVSIILIYVIRNREKIIGQLKEWLQEIKAWLKRIGMWLFGNRAKQNKHRKIYRDYEEIVEEVDADSAERLQHHISGKEVGLRKWKRAVKKYLKQGILKNNYREGYKLILQGAKLQGVSIRQVETAREITREMKSQLGLSDIDEATFVYEEVRYGEEPSNSAEMNHIVLILEQLLQVKK